MKSFRIIYRQILAFRRFFNFSGIDILIFEIKQYIMKSIFTLFFLLISGIALQSQTGIPVPYMQSCDQEILDFLNKYPIPGATMAISRGGRLVYMRGFGNADLNGFDPVQPYHKFRIASVSKPITSIAIMKLMENGQLKLTDTVFGPSGLLKNHLTFSKLTITDKRIFNITVKNLLEHNAGWDRDINCYPNPVSPYPWWFPGCDPIAVPLHVTETLGVPNPVTEENMISFLLFKGLEHDPGTTYAYSNVGFLVLGEIIKELSGYSYEKYVQDSILAPLGICDIELGNNKPINLDRREAEYDGHGYLTLSSSGSGELVPWEYGGFSIEAMDAHGGWIATARDLVKLIVAIDGFSSKPDILKSATIAEMVKPSITNKYYAKGWSVNSANMWWHGGSLNGSSSLIARTQSGYTWAFLMNTRIEDAATVQAFNTDLGNIPLDCISGATSWPTHDLMLFPSNAGYGVELPKVADKSVELTWTPGDGDRRIVVVTENGYFNKYPLDGINYDAVNTFGQGSDLGNNSYVVYDGNGSSVLINGLKELAGYAFSIYEYNQNSATGDYPLYQLCNNQSGLFFTQGSTSTSNINEFNFNISPNPCKEDFMINTIHNFNGKCAIEIMDSKGKVLKSLEQYINKDVDMRDFAPGLYFIKVIAEGKTGVRKLIRVN